MDEHIRERREETWRLLHEMGVDYSDVVRRIADQFDEKETTIRTDISRMDNWLPKLDDGDLYNGLSRARELRSARYRQRQYEMMAQRDEEYEVASRIADRIAKNLVMEREFVQALGLISEEPVDTEVAQGLDETDEALLDEWSQVGEPLDPEEI